MFRIDFTKEPIERKPKWKVIMDPIDPFIQKAEKEFNDCVFSASSLFDTAERLDEKVVFNYAKLVASY